jgi:hypothetical protein
MHWRLDATGVTAETVRSALEAQNPFLKPMGPKDDSWMNSITPEQKAHVKLAIDAACAVVETEQRVQLGKIVEVATAATASMVVPGKRYNLSVSGHDGSHVPGVVSRVSINLDEVVDVAQEPRPDTILLGEKTANASSSSLPPDPGK